MKTKNTIIKVLALLAVVGAIVYVIRKQRDDFQKFDDTKITEFDFHKYIKQRIEEELPENVDWQEAMETYSSLYGVIHTENSIRLNNGDSLLKSAEAYSCYEDAFNGFYPKFQKHADDYFGMKHDDWDKDRLYQIKNMADSLRKMEGSEQKDADLKKYSNYVDKYYDVSKDKKGNPMYENKNKELDALIDNCASKKSFDNVIVIRDEFNKYPYINNNAFAATINKAETKAKKKWESKVNDQVEKLVKKPDEYWAEQKTVNDTLVITWSANSLTKFDENEYVIKSGKRVFDSYGYTSLYDQVNELNNNRLKDTLNYNLRERREHIISLNGTTIKKPINNEN